MEMLEPMYAQSTSIHVQPCHCTCGFCASGLCADMKSSLRNFMNHSLCPSSIKMVGSNHSYYNWNCINLQCDYCWLNRGYHILNCPLSNWDSDNGTPVIIYFYPFFSANLTSCFLTALISWNTYMSVDHQVVNRTTSANAGFLHHLCAPPRRLPAKMQFVKTTTSQKVFSAKLIDAVRGF